MADTVDTKVIFNGGRYYVVHLQNQSDGTGESDVTKVDISTLLTSPQINYPGGRVCTYTAIDRIEHSIAGFNYVLLKWDHTTDDEIATLAGPGVKDWSVEGGNVDPRTAGGTGDILLTTNGGAAGAAYDITIWLRTKA